MKYAIIHAEGFGENKVQYKSVHRTLSAAKRALGRGRGRIIEVGDDERKGGVTWEDWLRTNVGRETIIVRH
jgi:hypothetical protein